MNTPVLINVLIVEDDPIHTFIAETMLKDDFKTTSVISGPEALEAIEKEKFDVILMDINLNHHMMDGIQTMRKIKYQQKHKRTKVIAVTAGSDAREWYIKQGFDGHHMKPLTGESLEEEIMMTMERACVLLV